MRGGAAAGVASRGRRRKHQAFSVFDADDDVLTLYLDVAPGDAGFLTVARPGGAIVVGGDGTDDAGVALRGRPSDLNLALEDVVFEAAAGFFGDARVTARVHDDGLRCGNATANGTDDCVRGANGTGYADVGVFVRKTNDAPTLTVAGGPFGAAPDGAPLVIRGAVVVADADAAEDAFGVDPRTGLAVAPRLLVTLSADRGRLSLASLDASLSFLEGEGTHDRATALDGTIDDLNAALSVLTYDCWTADGCGLGKDTIRVAVDDGGHSGAGGPKTATATLDVLVVGY